MLRINILSLICHFGRPTEYVGFKRHIELLLNTVTQVSGSFDLYIMTREYFKIWNKLLDKKPFYILSCYLTSGKSVTAILKKIKM